MTFHTWHSVVMEDDHGESLRGSDAPSTISCSSSSSSSSFSSSSNGTRLFYASMNNTPFHCCASQSARVHLRIK